MPLERDESAVTVLLPPSLTDLEGVPDELVCLGWDGREAPSGPAAAAELVVLPYGSPLRAAKHLGSLGRLRVVQAQSAGVDDLVGLVPEGVTLCNARGVHDASTAELAVALLLASLRRLDGHVRDQTSGTWPTSMSFAPSLADRRVMVLGYGSIGAAVERRLAGFEVEVVRVASRAREGEHGVVHGVDELPALLPGVDAVVVLTPLTDATRGLVDAAFLARLPDGAVLVNVARGAVVDTAVLLAETTSGRLRAALDVTDPEPLPADHPLWQVPGVIITPHVGGVSSAMRPRVRSLLVEQLGRFARDEPLANVVVDGGSHPPR